MTGKKERKNENQVPADAGELYLHIAGGVERRGPAESPNGTALISTKEPSTGPRQNPIFP